MEKQLEILTKQLGKKSTFESAVKGLIELVKNEFQAAKDYEQTKVISAVIRVYTLLQTRYTSIGLWKLGLNLFQTTLNLVQNSKEKIQLQSHIQKAEEFIRENAESNEDEVSTELPERQLNSNNVQSNYLFEGQLSSSEQAPHPPWLIAQSAHLAVMSALYQPPSPIANEVSESNRPNTLNSQSTLETQPPNGGGEAATEDEEEREANQDDDPRQTPSNLFDNLRNRMDQLNRLLDSFSDQELNQPVQRNPTVDSVRNLLEVFRNIRSHMDQFGEDTAGLEAAIQATLADVPRGAPPASKKEVEKLPLFQIEKENVSEYDGKFDCTICREEYAVDDYVQKMPCSHLFHMECLSPWLKLHNSCPVCRFEMKTDDEEYERRKVRDKEIEEERHGVENAVQEGAYMYL